MRILIALCFLAIAVLSTGCAKDLTANQHREYAVFKAEATLVEVKSPTTAALLGILPGCGSFYVREPGYGIVNLLLWPISIC